MRERIVKALIQIIPIILIFSLMVPFSFSVQNSIIIDETFGEDAFSYTMSKDTCINFTESSIYANLKPASIVIAETPFTFDNEWYCYVNNAQTGIANDSNFYTTNVGLRYNATSRASNPRYVYTGLFYDLGGNVNMLGHTTFNYTIRYGGENAMSITFWDDKGYPFYSIPLSSTGLHTIDYALGDNTTWSVNTQQDQTQNKSFKLNDLIRDSNYPVTTANFTNVRMVSIQSSVDSLSFNGGDQWFSYIDDLYVEIFNGTNELPYFNVTFNNTCINDSIAIIEFDWNIFDTEGDTIYYGWDVNNVIDELQIITYGTTIKTDDTFLSYTLLESDCTFYDGVLPKSDEHTIINSLFGPATFRISPNCGQNGTYTQRLKYALENPTYSTIITGNWANGTYIEYLFRDIDYNIIRNLTIQHNSTNHSVFLDGSSKGGTGKFLFMNITIDNEDLIVNGVEMSSSSLQNLSYVSVRSSEFLNVYSYSYADELTTYNFYTKPITKTVLYSTGPIELFFALTDEPHLSTSYRFKKYSRYIDECKYDFSYADSASEFNLLALLKIGIGDSWREYIESIEGGPAKMRTVMLWFFLISLIVSMIGVYKLTNQITLAGPLITASAILSLVSYLLGYGDMLMMYLILLGIPIGFNIISKLWLGES